VRRLLLLLTLICITLPTLATTVVGRSVEELAARSSHVVVGRAVRTWSKWNAEQRVVFTYTEFAVERSLKGSAPTTVTVRQLGGHANGLVQKVAGARPLRTGESAVLFLRPSAQHDGTMAVTSLMQGHFRMKKREDGEIVVSNGISGASQLDRNEGTVSAYKGTEITLKQLEERVRRVAK
jgi:hypothetical protein